MEAGSIIRRFHKREMNEISAKELELEVIAFIHSKIDSIALVKLQLQAGLQELEFFKSFLKDVADYDHLDEDAEEYDVILVTTFVKTQLLENLDEKMSSLRDNESPSAFAQVASEGNSSLFNEELDGFGCEGQTIVAKLIMGPAELDIISVVGMPGLEKDNTCKESV
ncbi:hypothetical protein CQW23_01535 [Capsicum baccatum]|uniref:Uncharacterized protein n=1 Tax=Capsicum baccatum TaxID=33114 RepID=A0A2G2XNU7_CAPBA|nr:hypothetical protein CQW23_01535 [Capsicum baccatum]